MKILPTKDQPLPPATPFDEYGAHKYVIMHCGHYAVKLRVIKDNRPSMASFVDQMERRKA